MSPPKPWCVDEIGAFWTDEQVIVCLRGVESGTPLPPNVVANVNPLLNEPSKLSEDTWYVVYSEDPKQKEVDIWYVVYSKDPKQANLELGFWKTKGDPCQIYSDSAIVGWRTTLEFYIGHSSNVRRTDWVMQKYSISDDIRNKVKGASSLCRVFLSEREGDNKPNDDANGQINLLHDKDNKSEPLKNKLHEDLEIYEAMFSRQENNLLHAECFAQGDYIELEDLNSSSSSSGNSSCVTPASDLGFDPDAFLQELRDDEINQPKSSSYKLSVSRPNDTVFVAVAAKESTISGNDKSLGPVKVEAPNDAGASTSRQAPGGDKGKKSDAGPSSSRQPPGGDKGKKSDAGPLSSRQPPGGDKGKKVYGGKSIKKFFCFMAF